MLKFFQNIKQKNIPKKRGFLVDFLRLEAAFRERLNDIEDYGVGSHGDYPTPTTEEQKNKQFVLGLGGALGSGKDAFADFIKEQPRARVRVIGMSDPLLSASLILDPIIEVPQELGGGYRSFKELYEENDSDYVAMKKNYPYFRSFLQRLGTEFGRQMISEDVWVKVANNTIVELIERGYSVVITGIRYPNELDMLHNFIENNHSDKDKVTTKTMYVYRPDSEGETRKSQADLIGSHSSENSLSPSDFQEVLVNDSTLEELKVKAKREYTSLMM